MGLRNRGQKENPVDRYFIGRENMLEDFAREWSKSIYEKPLFIVNLHGLSGIGKSKLLKQFLFRSPEKVILCSLDANFDYLNDPLTVIETILRRTRQTSKSIEFNKTQKLITKLDKLVNEAAKASGQSPRVIARMLTRVAQVSGELIGGTETGKVLRELGEPATQLIELGIDHMAMLWRAAKDEQDSKLLRNPLREITAELVKEMKEMCNRDTKFVLAIDTYEKVSSEVNQWLLRDLLREPDITAGFDFRLIIAGREPLARISRYWHDEWRDRILSCRVEPFTVEETSAFLLQRRGITDPQVVEKLHKITKGYPIWLDLWAKSEIDEEHFFSTGHLKQIEDRLFDMFPDPKHQVWLRQAAFFQRFNQDLLGLLIKDEVDTAFEWLVHQSSLVEGDGKQWKIHDIARKIILTNLCNRSQALLREPATIIIKHFEKKLQRPWEQWRDLRLRLTLTEQDLQRLTEISYYKALANAELSNDHLDMILRVSDFSAKAIRNLLNSALQAINELDISVSQKFTFIQELIEKLTGELREEDIDKLKSDLLQLDFSEYQKTILFNRMAWGYGDKFKRLEKAMACLNDGLVTHPEYESALMFRARLNSDTNPEDAIAVVKIVLVNNPSHEDALFRFGYCCNELGRHDEAISHYQSAAKINPKDRVVYANWAWSLHRLGRHEEAIQQCKKAIAIDPKYLWAYNSLGNYLRDLGRHDQAIEEYKKAIAIDAKYMPAYLNWGRTLGELGRHKEAIELYKKAIEIDPKYVGTYTNWGGSLNKLGRHQEAIEQYIKAIEIDPKYVWAYTDLGDCLRDLHRYDEAIEQYKKAIEIDPKYVWAYYGLGNCLRDLHRYDEAIEQYKKAIEIDPKYIWAYTALGDCLQDLRRYDEAIEQYKEAIEIDPKHVWAYNSIGSILRDEGRLEEAIEQYKKAIEIDPKYVGAYGNWGRTLSELGRHREAIEQFRKAVEIDPKYVWAYNSLGNSLRELGLYEEAVEQYKKAIEINPQYDWSYNNWGRTLTSLGRYAEAIEQYKRATEIDPKYVSAYINWGDALGALGRYQEAIEKFERAIEIDPKSSWAYNDKGFAHACMGELELAIYGYTKALEIDPEAEEAFYNLAIAKKKLNSIDAAGYVEKVRQHCVTRSNDSRKFYGLAGLAAVEGDVNLALEMLQQAANKDFQFTKHNAHCDIAFESIRSTLEFKAIFEVQS